MFIFLLQKHMGLGGGVK